MLRYLARTAPTVLSALASRRRDARITRLTRRVQLTEIDTNLHMNQAAYLQVGELARVDWAIRCDAVGRWRAEALKPLVAEQRVVYRRELAPLQRYVLDTRAVRVDGKLLWLETNLLVGRRVHARVDAALLFVGEGRVVGAPTAARVHEPLLAEPLAVRDWELAEAHDAATRDRHDVSRRPGASDPS
jgi:acyl-CoA thioesterase FadM